MTLAEQIVKDMTAAMKEQNKFTLSVLRMLKSSLQMEQINKKNELSEEETIAVIKKQVKMRKDSIEEFKKYEKIEEIENLNKEIEVLSAYLPEELSEEEIDKTLEEIFSNLNPSSIKDMGLVMKEATNRFAGRADMTLVSKKVREKLN